MNEKSGVITDQIHLRDASKFGGSVNRLRSAALIFLALTYVVTWVGFLGYAVVQLVDALV